MGALIKFGARAAMEQFLEEGLLYMNTLKWYSNAEQLGVQGSAANDPLVTRWQATLVTLHFGEIAIHHPRASRVLSEPSERINVFCMYLYDLQSAWVDPKNHRALEMCAVIYKQAAFMERLVAAFEAQSQFNHLAAGSVRYVDPEIQPSELSPFVKQRGYSYQHEFRVAFSPGLGDPCLFRIGDLTDIGFLMHASTVNHIPMHVNLLPPKR